MPPPAPPAMNELAQRILAILERHAVFPLPILTAQCKHLKKAPDTLQPEDVPRLAESLGRAVALFSSPAKGQAVTTEVLRLGPTPPPPARAPGA